MTHTLKTVRFKPSPLVVTLVLTLLILTLLVVMSGAHAQGLGIATAVNKNAGKACTEMQTIAKGPWPKAFMVAGGAFAIWGIFRKERDGFQNLIWVGAFASIFAGITGVLSAFGIGC